jgi:hypothetical protein
LFAGGAKSHGSLKMKPSQKNTLIRAAALVAAVSSIIGAQNAKATEGQAQSLRWQFADGQTNRHCHQTPRRMYCHTSKNLPVTIRTSPTANV